MKLWPERKGVESSQRRNEKKSKNPISFYFRMPQILSGHPTASIVMIAEKASDLIKQQYSNEI